MKFATAATSGRAAKNERQRRDRAAAPLLRTSYPRLATLQLDFAFNDNTEFLPSPQVTVLHPPARAYFCFACPYGDCDGEFDLRSPVDRMVSAEEASCDGQMQCTGTRHAGSRCSLRLDYSIAAQWT